MLVPELVDNVASLNVVWTGRVLCVILCRIEQDGDSGFSIVYLESYALHIISVSDQKSSIQNHRPSLK